MALLYKIDNSIYVEDLNSNQFDIALNGALFKYSNESSFYTIFNNLQGVSVQIKVSDIPSYTNDLAVAYSEASLLAFLRLNTGAMAGSSSGGGGVTNHSGLTLDDGTNPHGTTKTDVGLSNVPNLDTSTTSNINDTTAKRFVSDAEKTAITHSNRSILDLITESFTTALKTAYDSTVTWISTNGANVLSHLSSTSNPHSTTASQVGAYTTSQVDTALGLKQDTLVSGTNIKTVEGVSLLGSGNLRLLDETRVFLFNDFLSATALQPFVGGAISTGTIAQNTTNFSANTLGVCRITKSTTANSGYRVVTDSNAIRLKGGEVYPIRFCPLNLTTQTLRGGFIDATTVTESVDGVYFQIQNNGALVLKTSNNSVRTSSAVLATLVINTWYKIEVVIGANATTAYMNLYNAVGTLIATTPTIGTNIPTGVGRETGCGFVSTGSSVTADALLDIDFHYFEQTLTR